MRSWNLGQMSVGNIFGGGIFRGSFTLEMSGCPDLHARLQVSPCIGYDVPSWLTYRHTHIHTETGLDGASVNAGVENVIGAKLQE